MFGNYQTHQHQNQKQFLKDYFGAFFKIRDLFSRAIVDEDFREISLLVFKQKYGEATFTFDVDGVWIHDKNGFLNETFDWYNHINQYNFLRYFGNAITKLHVYTMYSTEQIAKIREHISKYCPEASVKESLRLFKLPDMVPNHPTFTHKSLVSYLQHDIDPSVKSFGVGCERLDEAFVNALIAGLPQLDSLSIRCQSYYFKPSAKLIILNLKKFSFFQINLATSSMVHKIPPSIIFMRLTALELGCPSTLTVEWMKFITRNNNLTRLELHCVNRFQAPIKNDHWIQLIDSLPKLRKLVVDEKLINRTFQSKITRKCIESSVDLHLYERNS